MRRCSELGEDMAALVEKVDAGVLPASDLHERGLRRAVKPRRWSAGPEEYWRHGNSTRGSPWRGSNVGAALG